MVPGKIAPIIPSFALRAPRSPGGRAGHATVIEGPAGDWWMIYHGYENGFRTLGRQALLEPVEWTDDGWFRATGGTLSTPLPKTRGVPASPAGFALSDDFSTNKFGVQWSFFNPGPSEMDRARYQNKSLVIKGKGSSVANCSPLTMLVGDKSYEASIELDISEDVQGGLVLFYSERAYCGVGFSRNHMHTYHYGQELGWMRQDLATKTVHLRVTNRENVVSFHYSRDGAHWTRHPRYWEVSGFHHNVFDGFLSLKVGIYSAGKGQVVASNFIYRGLAT